VLVLLEPPPQATSASEARTRANPTASFFIAGSFPAEAFWLLRL
jgi:hypothetical protein